MRIVSSAALVLLLGVALIGCTSSSNQDPSDSDDEISLEPKLPMTGPNQVVLAVPGMT